MRRIRRRLLRRGRRGQKRRRTPRVVKRLLARYKSAVVNNYCTANETYLESVLGGQGAKKLFDHLYCDELKNIATNVGDSSSGASKYLITGTGAEISISNNSNTSAFVEMYLFKAKQNTGRDAYDAWGDAMNIAIGSAYDTKRSDYYARPADVASVLYRQWKPIKKFILKLKPGEVQKRKYYIPINKTVQRWQFDGSVNIASTTVQQNIGGFTYSWIAIVRGQPGLTASTNSSVISGQSTSDVGVAFVWRKRTGMKSIMDNKVNVVWSESVGTAGTNPRIYNDANGFTSTYAVYGPAV